MWCSGNVTESAALDKHRSERRMAARVLRVLRGLAGLNAGASGAGWGGLGRHFLWENSCYHTVIPHQGLVPGSRFQLDQTHSACQRGTCVSVWCVHVFKCVCVRLCVSAVATYSCQTSVDRHEHPSGSLPGAWDILLLLSAWKESESHG